MNQLELLAAVLSAAAAACYLVGGALLQNKREKPAAVCLSGGWSLNLAIFLKNLLLNGYAPFASMYQVLSVLSLCFLPIGWILTGKRKEDRWLWPYFIIPAAIPLIGTLFMDKQLKWALVPALQSVWFVPHVLSYMLSYCLAAVAFVLTVVSLFRREESACCDRAVNRILRISFPFMTTGLCFGALWADQVWGSFWQWDVKEIWSLITVLCYLCYFHWLRRPNGARAAKLWSILGFASLIVTFLCVDLLPSVEESLHLYA